MTFPVPPSEAGPFDAGPLVVLAVLVILLQMARSWARVKGWWDETVDAVLAPLQPARGRPAVG